MVISPCSLSDITAGSPLAGTCFDGRGALKVSVAPSLTASGTRVSASSSAVPCSFVTTASMRHLRAGPRARAARAAGDGSGRSERVTFCAGRPSWVASPAPSSFR